MMLGVDLDEIHSIDPSYSKGINTIVIAKLHGYDIIKNWPQSQNGVPYPGMADEIKTVVPI